MYISRLQLFCCVLRLFSFSILQTFNKTYHKNVQIYEFGYAPLFLKPYITVFCYFIDGLLIDTAQRNCEKLVLKHLPISEINQIALTHWHEDHSGNTAKLVKQHNAQVFAHPFTKEKILSNLRVLHKTMLEDFSIRKPRIAVLGLNPHAGDGGLIGDEEQRIILPAIKQANEEGIIALGPYPADGFFGAGEFKKFDATLAMFHDQGLIPFKSFAFESGVNYTAGLPIVRTSPGHGTAYSLAGTGTASEESFRNALYLAIDVYENRKRYSALSKNPLQRHEIDRTGGE